MGYSCHSYAVVGLAMKSQELFITKTVMTYLHDYPQTVKFCPETGKKLWTTALVFPDGSEYPEDSEKFKGLDIVTRGSEEDATDPQCLLVLGKRKRATEDGSQFWRLAEIEKVKKEIEEILTPYKLWDETRFGVYPVLYESC
jgi:hypothetical protein